MMGELLITRPPIQVMPTLAEAIGLNEAIVVQVVHYWLDPKVSAHFFEGCYWVENLAHKLSERFFFWDEETIGYMVASLEQSGFLVSRKGKAPDDSPVFYHTIDYGRLEELAPLPDEPLMVPSSPDDTSMQPTEPSKVNSNLSPPFLAKTHEKGENLYVMVVEDQRHLLACDLTLEIQEVSPKRSGAQGKEASPLIREVVCDFPGIPVGNFKKFVGNDETLYGALMVGFQLRLMKQLLLFCLARRADRLVIFVEDAEEADLRIYHEFQDHIGNTLLAGNKEAEVIIPTDRETIDAWMTFMVQVDTKLQQGLWRGQKSSKAIRHYLRHYGWPKL